MSSVSPLALPGFHQTSGLRDPARHQSWLRDQATALLDVFGTADLGRAAKLYQTGRLVFGFSAAAVLGRPGADDLVDAGLSRLRYGFRDSVYGGFVSALAPDGAIAAECKDCYGHAFVLLAVAGARAIGHPEATGLLADILQVLEEHFWDPAQGAAHESFSRNWQDEESYRGQNANMHLVEALLAAFEVTREAIHLNRAERIAMLIVDHHARAEGWRIAEHFTPDWKIDRAYEGSLEFRPHGTTPGHSFEWSRLLLQLWVLRGRDRLWLPEAAAGLFRRAWLEAWRPDGGLAYTLDWDGRPERPERLSWPCCEAIGASAWLHALAVVGDDWAEYYRTLWVFTATNFIRPGRGTWFPRLPESGPSHFLPEDQPDLYHTLQAYLLPVVPAGSGLIAGLQTCSWTAPRRGHTLNEQAR